MLVLACISYIRATRFIRRKKPEIWCKSLPRPYHSQCLQVGHVFLPFLKSVNKWYNPYKTGIDHPNSCDKKKRYFLGVSLPCSQIPGFAHFICFQLGSCFSALAVVLSCVLCVEAEFSKSYSGRWFHCGFSHGVKIDKKVRITKLFC